MFVVYGFVISMIFASINNKSFLSLILCCCLGCLCESKNNDFFFFSWWLMYHPIQFVCLFCFVCYVSLMNTSRVKKKTFELNQRNKRRKKIIINNNRLYVNRCMWLSIFLSFFFLHFLIWQQWCFFLSNFQGRCCCWPTLFVVVVADAAWCIRRHHHHHQFFILKITFIWFPWNHAMKKKG